MAEYEFGTDSHSGELQQRSHCYPWSHPKKLYNGLLCVTTVLEEE